MKTKKFYEQPLTVVTQVELESPICSGSADITNEKVNGVAIDDQKVNESFDYTPTTDTWDKVSNQ